MSYTQFIETSLSQASQIALKYAGNVKGITKPEDNNQVLTQADLDIGKFLIRQIESTYADHNIIDEEAGVINKNSEYTWVVDPIDGTSNFANGSPMYGIMLGLMKSYEPIASGIALPFFGEIILAEKSKGVFCNGKKLQLNSETDTNNLLVAYGIDGHREDPEFTRKECELLSEILLNIRNLRVSNSVFDTAMVLKGSYGAFLCQTSKIWDNVAQQIIIEEAGGKYTDINGEKQDYSQGLINPERNFSFLAASPTVHARLLEIIKKY